MSSEIIVHGYVEMIRGAEVESLAKLTASSTEPAGAALRLVPLVRTAIEGATTPLVAFATIQKKVSATHCDELQVEFEQILRKVDFFSAHLSIEDDEGVDDRHVDYVYGPMKMGGPDVLVRTYSRRIVGESEEIG